ncbi:PAS domain S-box-containing protein [Mesobacillus persicus]|uniref:PAS domain S-box-containing protein n=1 Tax=Mesobacillus persicus TaxID=930146 RepID=A0A1H8I4M6_9BACI|nr:sigma 54-interacting transcriptional regulator [Mesobacillus persicus]SEN62986.1 PAS domain S-box-containing protein [Mesobacillus persicus]
MSTTMKNIPQTWLEEIIRLSIERLVIVDRHGVIVYIDSDYCEFLGTTAEKAIGQLAPDIIENSRMHIVAKTGKEEIEEIQPINGSVMIANRYPIFIDGELVGAMGTVMFPNPENLMHYNHKIQSLVEELNFYKTKAEKELKSKYSFKDLTGNSRNFRGVKAFAERISVSDSSVLLTGESGTGKELFAHAIHNSSLRRNHQFVPINCAAIPEELFESELFGYADGAFTGSKKGGKKGLFEVANNGTVFLDEIGEMPLFMQSKLLRALQEKEIHPVGGQKNIRVDLRVIAATNRDLEKMVEEGSFRQDLYYRLNVIHIEIPALRERKEDIESISNELLMKLGKRFYRTGIELSTEVLNRFHQHSWPGNVRELENVLERAINLLDGNKVELAHLPLYLRDQEVVNFQPEVHVPASPENPLNQAASTPVLTLKETLAQAEKLALQNTLLLTNGNKLEAAKLLGIGKTSFYEKCKLYQL